MFGDWREKFNKFPDIIFILGKKQEIINRWFSPENVSIEKAIINRRLFFQSKNLVWRSIGMSDNVRSMYSKEIKDFLNHRILFLQPNFSFLPTILSDK